MIQPLIALDQLLNSLLGGWADETLSARAFRLSTRKRHWAFVRGFIDILFFWQESHCKQSFLSEQKRRHFPIEYRTGKVSELLDREFHNPLPQLLRNAWASVKQLLKRKSTNAR